MSLQSSEHLVTNSLGDSPETRSRSRASGVTYYHDNAEGTVLVKWRKNDKGQICVEKRTQNDQSFINTKDGSCNGSDSGWEPQDLRQGRANSAAFLDIVNADSVPETVAIDKIESAFKPGDELAEKRELVIMTSQYGSGEIVYSLNELSTNSRGIEARAGFESVPQIAGSDFHSNHVKKVFQTFMESKQEGRSSFIAGGPPSRSITRGSDGPGRPYVMLAKAPTALYDINQDSQQMGSIGNSDVKTN